MSVSVFRSKEELGSLTRMLPGLEYWSYREIGYAGLVFLGAKEAESCPDSGK